MAKLRYMPGGNEESHENLNQDRQCPCQHSERASPEYVASDNINYEIKMVWKKVVVAYSRYFNICLEELRKTTKNLSQSQPKFEAIPYRM
jgi:hypothetical protein